MNNFQKHRAEAMKSRHERRSEAESRGDMKADEHRVAGAVHKHESHLHKGEPKTKLREGGKIEGRARGGRLDKSSKRPITINVISGGQPQPPLRVPVPVPTGGPPPGAGAMPPRPMPQPGMGPPPGMGGPGMPPPGMMGRRHGGRTPKVDGYASANGAAKFRRGGHEMTAGARSGEGRLEKSEMARDEMGRFVGGAA